MDFPATFSVDSTVPSVDTDPVVLEQLTNVLNDSIQELLLCSEEGGRNEIMLPNSLSMPQVDFVLNLVEQAKEIQVDLKWFGPMFSIVLKRKSTKPSSKRSPSFPPPPGVVTSRGPLVPLGPFTVYVTFSPHLRDAFNRFALMPSSSRYRVPPFSYNQPPSEPFQSNFSIITYINTEPLVPSKFAPKVGASLRLASQQGGGGVPHPLGPETTFHQPIGAGGGQFEISEADQLLLEQLSGVDRIHIVSGLCKVDKLDLALLLNNEALLEQNPCRIIYLQSSSILTFWMALKVKQLCGDYYWNSSGYQINLDTKSSPNNNIIFFELSTFMRALNLNIDTSLVTHLIVDIDDQNAVFFNLFLLYIKTNFDSLRHLRLIILARDHKQARALYDYFAPEIVNLVDWMDFHEHVVPETLGEAQGDPIKVAHLFLEDIPHHLSPKVEGLDSGVNAELEQLLPRILHTNTISPSVMIEFISAFPVLINYHCHCLNGLTPLIITVLRGTVDQLYSILAAGANAHLASWNGMTPIEWAIQAKREEHFHLLMVHLSTTNASFELNLKKYYLNLFVNSALNVGDLDAKLREVLVKKVEQKVAPLYDVDYPVILRLLLAAIRQLNQTHQPNTPLGTVIVLLPSYNSISTLRKQIIASIAPVCEYPFTTFCLYPYLPNNELDGAVSLFSSVGGSQVRIVLSTFTLDSLLLSNIRFVINTGIRLSKVQSGFTPTSQYRLVPNQSHEKVSEYRYYRDLFDQSAGQPVYIYNLFSRKDVLNHQEDEDGSEDSDLAYAETDSIYNCVFGSKYFKLKDNQKIGNLFGEMVSAPPKLLVDNAIYFLRSLNMLDDNERFTELGRILMDLSIEPHYGKMIIYSMMLRCLDPILTIVCALSSPNCFEITSINSAKRALEMQSLYELSHQSFSDHLSYVYAFQQWQDLCRSNPKNVSYDRSGIVLFSSFELVYSLRTKVLGQLRACGFVKGRGGMNIRQLNENSGNFTLVKAAICAGQPKDGLTLIHRDHVPRLVHREDREQPYLYLHPNSVLSYQLATGKGVGSFTSNLVMFDRKMTSGEVGYISSCTLVNPVTVAIFCDEVYSEQINLNKDNCIQFGSSSHGLKIVGEDAVRCFELRTRWQQYAKKRTINMHSPVSEEENAIIGELLRFCTMSDQQMGFGEHREIGRAPQVMSTYFCSTKMIAPGVDSFE